MSEQENTRSARSRLETALNKAWYEDARWSRLLTPLGAAYKAAIKLNRPNPKDVYSAPIPVVVVGNIVVGGAGKTPLVLALCDLLRAQGWRPAVLSRGYHAQRSSFPHIIRDSDSAQSVGDEPLLMHQRLNLPVCIDPQRSRGARLLIAQRLCDVIVCDDGLQHYKLARDVEVAVVDSQRLLGNGRCLPVGPLREPAARLDTVDFVVMNGDPPAHAPKHHAVMRLQADCLVNLGTGQRLSPAEFLRCHASQAMHAVSGIGNPQRFFDQLQALDIPAKPHSFPDHHQFSEQDLQFSANSLLIMTEKDAVKCRDFANERYWYLRVSALFDGDGDFEARFLAAVEAARARLPEQPSIG